MGLVLVVVQQIAVVGVSSGIVWGLDVFGVVVKTSFVALGTEFRWVVGWPYIAQREPNIAPGLYVAGGEYCRECESMSSWCTVSKKCVELLYLLWAS